MLKAVFFDLDGTLLPMDEGIFTKYYFDGIYNKVKSLGYTKEDLIKNIWAGTKAMYKNDGSRTNEDAFWSYFESVYGKESVKDKAIFDDYYTHEFADTKVICEDNPYAKKIVDFCHKNNLICVLSTNPIFPENGTFMRMSFVNLKKEDFDFVTTYNNSSFTKPNPMYFKTLLDKFNLKPEEVVLFGNNTLEDGECSLACGIRCYIVGNYIINDPRSTHDFPHISMEMVIDKIQNLINEG